jgi:DNA-binding beta-propeller fold protein YncE
MKEKIGSPRGQGTSSGEWSSGRTAVRWRRAAVVAAAAVLPLAAAVAVAAPASAVAPYTVTATIGVGEEPLGVAVDPATHTATSPTRALTMPPCR